MITISVKDDKTGISQSQSQYVDYAGITFSIVGAMDNGFGDVVVLGYSAEHEKFTVVSGNAGKLHSFKYFTCHGRGHVLALRLAAEYMTKRFGVFSD
jgi:hypothetical protein